MEKRGFNQWLLAVCMIFLISAVFSGFVLLTAFVYFLAGLIVFNIFLWASAFYQAMRIRKERETMKDADRERVHAAKSKRKGLIRKRVRSKLTSAVAGKKRVLIDAKRGIDADFGRIEREIKDLHRQLEEFKV